MNEPVKASYTVHGPGARSDRNARGARELHSVAKEPGQDQRRLGNRHPGKSIHHGCEAP